MARINIISFGHLLMLAKRTYQNRGEHDFECRSVIILSALAVECFLNEVQGLAESDADEGIEETAKLARLLSEAENEKASLLFKVSLAHFVCTGMLVDKGAQPFRTWLHW